MEVGQNREKWALKHGLHSSATTLSTMTKSTSFSITTPNAVLLCWVWFILSSVYAVWDLGLARFVFIVMLSVIILNVIMVSVVAPPQPSSFCNLIKSCFFQNEGSEKIAGSWRVEVCYQVNAKLMNLDHRYLNHSLSSLLILCDYVYECPNKAKQISSFVYFIKQLQH